jgi:hypothetical protein
MGVFYPSDQTVSLSGGLIPSFVASETFSVVPG